MTEEYFDIIKSDGTETNTTASRTEVHEKGLWHKTAHVWIIRKHNNRTQVLLQKRALTKDSFPGQYDISSAGHVITNETPCITAIRELEEELGLFIEPDDLTYIGQFTHNYKGTFHNKPFIDNEHTYVYVYQNDIDTQKLKLQSEEISSVKWFDVTTVRNCIENQHDNICIDTETFAILLQYIKHS